MSGCANACIIGNVCLYLTLVDILWTNSACIFMMTRPKHSSCLHCGAGTLVQWLKLPAWKGGGRRNHRFLIIDNHVKNTIYGNFVFKSGLTGECAAQKLKNFCSSSLWTCLHHMVILRSQNKITDFFMIIDLGQSL